MRSKTVLIAFAAMMTTTVAHAQGPEMQALDLMPMADTNTDGKVTQDEYLAFSVQGWGFVSQGADQVKVASLDAMGQMAFFGITPNAEGMVTKQMYIDAVPARFKQFDADKNGTLNADEINGKAFQQN